MGRGEVGAAQGSLIGKLPRTSGCGCGCGIFGIWDLYQWDYTSGITSGIQWDSTSGILWDSLGFFGDLDRHYSLGSSFHSSVWQRHNIILMEIPHTTH
jgi:hypothetical protein